MLQCPTCQEANDPASKLCRRCGNLFVRTAATTASQRNPLHWLLLGALLIAGPLLGVAIWQRAALKLTYYGTKLHEKGPDFRGQEIKMKRIEAKIENGFLEVPLALIEELKLVQFYYPGPTMNIPLIAYIGPSGRLITAFSWCELCQTNGYHFESNTLVCNKCSTTWALEGDGPTPQHRPSHFGFAGNCKLYGPEFVENTVQDGKVRIAESLLKAWRPREGSDAPHG